MTARPSTTRAFRTRLRQSREKRGLSQADLAAQAGLQQSALSHYENGARRPSFTNLRKLAKALRVSTDYLVGQTADAREVDHDLARQIAQLGPRDQSLVRELVESLSRQSH